mgnify:CR=1 FL=1
MRIAKVNRKTKETSIEAEINLDGTGIYKIDTGIGFLNHMLEQLSKHSLVDINLKAKGDLHIDLPSVRCVGYRQVWAAMDATPNPAQQDAVWWQAVREQGVAATRQLAKRQLTWLRSMQRTVVACDAPDATAQGLAAIGRLLDGAGA